MKDRLSAVYSMHPLWLEHSLKKTLKKLGVETLDCLLLSEPINHGLNLFKSHDKAMRQIKRTFAFLEEQVQAGRIKAYGVHSPVAFMFDPVLQAVRDGRPLSEARVYQLQELVELAEQVAGRDHHFRFLQCPVSE